eukprot:470046_1
MTMKQANATVYGNIVIPYNTQKIHQWQFKIKKYKWANELTIGIGEADYKSLHSIAHHNEETNNYVCDCYGYLTSKGELHGTEVSSFKKPEDILTMEFNGMINMLSFQVNNKDKQNAFEIEHSDIGYTMIVESGRQDDSVQLLSYKCIHSTDDNKSEHVSVNDDKKTFWQDEKLKLIEERDIAKAQSESLKSELVGKEKEINNFKNEIKLLKEKNNKLMYDNGKLLDDQKGMEIEINKLKKENKELRRNNINTKNYKQWNWEQIIFWILSLDDGKYNQYENQLMKHLKEEAIEGDDLTEIKEDDLMRWGIKKFKDKKNVMKYIKQLTNNNHQNVDNEGGKPAPTAYI